MKEYDIDEIYKTAGRAITDRLLAVMTEKGVIKWFYQPIPALGNKKPCDLCGAGKQQELEQLISELESGIFQH